ncbi:ATP-dependent DNA ligase [Dacryopinax primogenitus]|uniref:DNA ligase n=1 Tax=Dacryopinax primogenitus (strain DJM 731) TaxID=1858805 RepID=M5FNY6_DACPD|nr:ATP-dependent DNA ligase [Dacryopinax primogenitus]EJT98065.1 ATP-dependent DNA ligase [Dacryopinax primogenitus]
MARQATLGAGKFFQMPPGVRAPSQQTSLNALWAKSGHVEPRPGSYSEVETSEQDHKANPLNDVENGLKKVDVMSSSQSLEVDQGWSNNANMVGTSPYCTEKRKHGPIVEIPDPPKQKKRRVDINSEDDGGAANANTLSDTPGVATPHTQALAKGQAHEDEGGSKSDGGNEANLDEGDEADLDEDEYAVDDETEEDSASLAAELAAGDAFLCKQTPWQADEPVPYAALISTFTLIESTSKRIEITTHLTAFFFMVIRLSPKELLKTVYLCINRLCPDYVGLELGVGESILEKAIAESTGRSLAKIKADLKKEGDLGLVAMMSRNTQPTMFKPKPLTVSSVFAKLTEIARVSGNASQAKKIGIIKSLLATSVEMEPKFIIRSLEGKLRIRLAERTVLVAVAWATVLRDRGSKKWSKEKLASELEEGANIVKSVYSELPSYDCVIPALLDCGISGLREHCKLTPGIPLKPMLAKPTKAIGEVLDRFEGKTFTCEYKYDGERAQIHQSEDGTIKIFSRNSEDMSLKYPDLIDQLPGCINEGTSSFVLDAEAVAIERATMNLLPFQELSRRKRKDVRAEDVQVTVCLFAFDLLYLNGEPLLHKDLLSRRQLLYQHFHPVPGEFDFANSSDGSSTEEIQTFLDQSVKDGCEGLMVKMLQSDASYYEPSRRSVNWLKLKKDYLTGVGDSFDLVVVGAYHGHGKRTAVYGAFLLACYDSDSEQFQTICKIGTGFTDDALLQHHNTLKGLEVDVMRSDIAPGQAKPDVWFTPTVVWEVLAADLSLSPVYTAAQGLVEERGISLRFPRFIRVRDDKAPEDSTSPEQIADMYERQALAQSKGGKKRRGDGEIEDDFW